MNYILGNPPFVGYSCQNATQKEDLAFVTKGIQGVGVPDCVCGWYLKAAQYVSGSQVSEASRDCKEFAGVAFAASKAKTCKKPVDAAIDDMFISFDKQDAENRKRVRCAFVSTKSITQGERVGALWGEMLRLG